MLISAMHTYFKLLYNKMDSLNYPNYEPEEIDVILNQEMFKIIEQRAYGNNPKREGVEETQKRVDDLREITQTYVVGVNSFVSGGNQKPNGYWVPLPSDYRHAIHEECLVGYTCNGATLSKRIPVKPISHDEYNKTIRDPFKEPYTDELIRLPVQAVSGVSYFEIIGDGVITISQYQLRYLRTPTSMQYGTTYSTPTTDVECELAEHIHREIVESAVRSALENIESPRFQTQPVIEKDKE